MMFVFISAAVTKKVKRAGSGRRARLRRPGDQREFERVKPGEVGKMMRPGADGDDLLEGQRQAEVGGQGRLVPGGRRGHDGRDRKRPVPLPEDDLIKSSGYRIGPEEIEEALVTHRRGRRGVVGVPDPVIGQKTKAFVVLKAGSRGPTS